jgi:PAT family acetyl-CoA transporter-like MFS transporter 1
MDHLQTQAYAIRRRRERRSNFSFTDVQLLIIMHLFAKFGFAANEAVTSLKIVEKGLKREDLAIAVLIDFPFQIVGGYLAARWSIGDKPLRPWVIAFWPRLGFAIASTLIVAWFPKPPLSMGFFSFLVVYTVISGLTSYATFSLLNSWQG